MIPRFGCCLCFEPRRLAGLSGFMLGCLRPMKAWLMLYAVAGPIFGRFAFVWEQLTPDKTKEKAKYLAANCTPAQRPRGPVPFYPYTDRGVRWRFCLFMYVISALQVRPRPPSHAIAPHTRLTGEECRSTG